MEMDIDNENNQNIEHIECRNNTNRTLEKVHSPHPLFMLEIIERVYTYSSSLSVQDWKNLRGTCTRFNEYVLPVLLRKTVPTKTIQTPTQLSSFLTYCDVPDNKVSIRILQQLTLGESIKISNRNRILVQIFEHIGLTLKILSLNLIRNTLAWTELSSIIGPKLPNLTHLKLLNLTKVDVPGTPEILQKVKMLEIELCISYRFSQVDMNTFTTKLFQSLPLLEELTIISGDYSTYAAPIHFFESVLFINSQRSASSSSLIKSIRYNKKFYVRTHGQLVALAENRLVLKDLDLDLCFLVSSSIHSPILSWFLQQMSLSMKSLALEGSAAGFLPTDPNLYARFITHLTLYKWRRPLSYFQNLSELVKLTLIEADLELTLFSENHGSDIVQLRNCFSGLVKLEQVELNKCKGVGRLIGIRSHFPWINFKV